MPVTSQFWMMSTPRLIGAARIAPGDRVVAHGAAAPLQQPAHDRKARIVEIEERAACSRTAVAVEQLGIDAVHAAWHCRAGR